ncbi:MAG: ABC transporter substrate-binding protein [Pseudonocardiaceae bacterium]|nr:ABC transporter substrate-binding protein [Pseudonocardiaceae bacterium]
MINGARWLALGAAILLGTAGCGGAAVSGGGGDDGGGPIKIGVLATLTGPTSDVGRPYNEGMLGYVDWVNEQGGIGGREIQALSDDYAYEIPRAQSLYKKYKSQGVVAIQGWGTGDSEALRNDVAQDELPFMSASYAAPLANPEESPYNFVVAPTYGDQMRVALDWIEQQGGAGTAEVAVLHNDSPFGEAPLSAGRSWIEQQGYDVGFDAYPMPEDAANYVGLLNQAQRQGAKYIVIQNTSTPAAQVAQDIQAQNLDMQIVCLNWCSDEGFIEAAGAEAAEGHVMVQPFATPASGKPGYEQVARFVEANGGAIEDKGLHYAQGWYTMHVMAQAIERVIQDGQEVTGSNIKSSLEGLSVDTGGVVGGGTVDFTTESHQGAAGTNIYQVRDGAMVEIAAGARPAA